MQDIGVHGELTLPLESVTVVPHFVVSRSLNLKRLVVRISPEVASLHSFASCCSSLESVDFGVSFDNVTSLGAGFCSGCKGLASIVLPRFTHLTHIASLFLANCESLEGVDLSSLSSVVDVGDDFMKGCTSLRTINPIPGSYHRERVFRVVQVAECHHCGSGLHGGV